MVSRLRVGVGARLRVSVGMSILEYRYMYRQDTHLPIPQPTRITGMGGNRSGVGVA